ncbi:MAG TPA: hypothetical protein V6D47_11785 [Oscillatoriaceae cyanobacterium]
MKALAKRWMCGGAMAIATALTGCGQSGLPTQSYTGTTDTVQLVPRGPGGTTRFLAHNVIYRLDPNVSMTLEDLNADVVLKDPSQPFVPANKNDYSILIHQAKVDKGPKSLAALMNNYVFAGPNAPIRNVSIKFVGNQIDMTGQMHKGVWVGFEMKGALTPTPDGKIAMTATEIKSLDVPVNGLMNLIGLKMSSLMTMDPSTGLTVQGNTIIMDLSKLYPPPRMMGRVTAVSISNNRLHITMDDGQAQPWPQLPVANPKSTMVMWGGDVLINNCLNLNAHMEILDATPQDPQIFALDRYRQQLEAGFVVPTMDGSMIAYTPDVTNFGNMGRYHPPTFPIPGMQSMPSDLPNEDAGTGYTGAAPMQYDGSGYDNGYTPSN